MSAKMAIGLAYWKLCSVLCLTMRITLAYDFCARNCGHYKHMFCETSPCEETFCEGNDPDWEWRSNMLFAHNVLRNHLATGRDTRGGNSAASNMMALSYHLGLELMAGCKLYQFGRKVRRCLNFPGFLFLGTNYFESDFVDPSTDAGMRIVVQQWYEQIVNTTGTVIDNFPSARYMATSFARFSQVVWAGTTHVGCARCENASLFYVLCMYGPSGNTNLSPVYIRGAPASMCPRGVTKSTKYEGLCGEEVLPPNATIPGLKLDIIQQSCAVHPGVLRPSVVLAAAMALSVSTLILTSYK